MGENFFAREDFHHGRTNFTLKAPTRSGSEANTALTAAPNVWSTGKGQFSLQSLQVTLI